MLIGEILQRFNGVKRIGNNRFQVKCPCHNDKQASLTITDVGDKILMKCHAGCNTSDILSKIGLEMKDLNNSLDKHKPTWKERISDLEAVYSYGKYLKIRCKGKKIRYGYIKNDTFVSGMPKGAEKCLYKAEQIKKAKSSNRIIYIVEGEKDCDNMLKNGFCCTTAGGVNDWEKEYAQNFKGAKVVILPDNDEAGNMLAERIKKDLRNIAFAVAIVQTSTKEKGDVSDYFAEGYTAESLREKVKQEVFTYSDWVTLNKDNEPSKINGGILADTIAKTLNYVLFKKKGIDVADFFTYENGVYNQKSRAEFKGYIKEYIPIRYQSDNILNNVSNLLLSSVENSYDYEIANDNEFLINFRNGIYDVKNRVLNKHNKDNLSTIQLNCNYVENAKCERWIAFIKTLCSDDESNVDEEKVRVLQEWFGLFISNIKVSKTKKCLALYSALGDTGKSKFLDVLAILIGDDNVAHIAIQNMSDRFAMGNLYGKRLNLVGDQKATDIEDSSMFKQLTGGDPVGVEMKGKTAFQFRFKGGFAFACNDLPHFKDDKGGHVFERFTIIKCEHHIPFEKRDKTLTDKLTLELDGIAQWALEGLHRLMDNGYNFSHCTSSDDAVNEYRSGVDTFYKFITENYILTHNKSDRIKKTDFEEKYSDWCGENEYSEIKKKNIKDRAAKSGIELGMYSGNWFYKGLVEKNYTVEDVKEEKEVPF